tara:strand:- start:2504 stop:2872 length:369 start_codon:yes stop_codon:yes gene_type:complete
MYFTKLKLLLLFFVVWNLISVASSKEVCLTNIGKDPVAFIVGHSMHWVDPRRGRCIKTNETEALIQNIDVKDKCSFDEKITSANLVNYACFRVRGEAGVCQADIEYWEFSDDCEKRVKRPNE